MSNADYKIKYVAPSKRFAEALNEQSFIPIVMTSKKSLAEPDDNVFVLNALEETNIERNSTTKYRINGKLQIITDNTLVDAWATTPIPDGAWTPETSEIDQTSIPRNWILQITYPFASDNEKNVVTTNILSKNNNSIVFDLQTKASEGFHVIELLPFNYKTGITNVLIRTAQKHGIKTIDDYVYLKPKNNFLNDGVDTYNYLGLQKILAFEESYDAGHWKTRGAHRYLAYDEVNINGQCSRCNTYMSGNEAAQRPRLIAKWGEDEVLRLESSSKDLGDKSFTRESLLEIEKYYKDKLKELKENGQ